MYFQIKFSLFGLICRLKNYGSGVELAALWICFCHVGVLILARPSCGYGLPCFGYFLRRS